MSKALLELPEIQEISNQSKGSFYFLDFDVIENNFQELWTVFKDYYPNTQLAYSFKTNYAPKICALVKTLGGWAEVVSEMEYDMALQIGFPAENIIVNGPLHSAAFIERCLLDRAWVNLDSWYLLEAVTAICKKHPEHQFHLGIRLTFNIREAGFSRFGIEAIDENMKRLKDWEANLHNCKIIGFHSHFSNSSRSLDSFTDRLDQMVKWTNRHFGNELPEFVNIGGGFLGKMPDSLSAQFKGNTPDYLDYAKVVAKRLKESYKDENAPILFLEPGTAVVADAMDFICKVHEVKKIEDQYYAVVDGSNHNINHKWGNEELPIKIYRANSAQDPSISNFKIVGNTCIEKDVMRKQVDGSIAIGDFIAFQYTGAYTNVLKQPFIHPCQPIFGRQKGKFSVVKRQEKMEDILATYQSAGVNKLPKKYCIATITCDDFCVGTEVLLYSFLKYNPWFDGDINIVIDQLSAQSRQRLAAIYPINFIKADPRLTSKIEVLKTHFEHLRDIHLRFYSLEAFNMTNYEKVVYLDSDMYCVGDIKELFLNDSKLLACLDGFSYEEYAAPIVEKAGLILNTSSKRYGKHFKNSFNAGVLAIAPPILSQNNFKELMAMLDLEAWKGLGKSIFTDQMIINRFFENQFSIISSKYNYMIFLGDYLNIVDKISFRDISIVHFAGKIKPWNNYRKEEILKKAPHYLRYIEIWRELLSELRNKNNIKHTARKIIEQFEWTESGADAALEIQNRIY